MSFDERVALRFARMKGLCDGRSCVLWKVCVDGSKSPPCRHVSLISRSHIPTEKEYLFQAHSVFTVQEASYKKGTPDDPHVKGNARGYSRQDRSTLDGALILAPRGKTPPTQSPLGSRTWTHRTGLARRLAQSGAQMGTRSLCAA